MMSKIILDNLENIDSGFGIAKINSNFQKIADNLNEKVLFRDNPAGEANDLKQDVNLNGKDLYNIGSLKATTLFIGGAAVESVSIVDRSVVGITGTTAEFNDALTDGSFATGGGTATGTNTGDDAVNSLYSGFVSNVEHTGDVTGATELTIANDAVTNAKAANMVQATIKGRAVAAGTGDPTDLTPTEARAVLNVADGANAYTHPNHTGDVTSTGDGVTAIAAGVIVNADINAAAAIALSKLATDPLARANHTGTQAASTITNFATEVAGTAAVTANTAKVTNATHTGDVTGATELTIANDAVTNAKLANMATKTYKGRTSGTTGDPEDVAVATLKTDLGLVKGDVGLGNVDNTSDANKPVSTATQTALNEKQATLVSGTNIKTVNSTSLLGSGNVAITENATHTGDVTGATVLTIANSAVTLAKMANLAQNTIIGRVTASTGVPEALTAANVRTVINVADGATVNDTDANLRARSSHTGTQAASTISDFQSTVSANTDVAANTAKVTNATHTGDVTGATELTISAGAVTLAKQANMATASVVYRKTAGAGAPEVQTLATLKTDLGLTGTNSGDYTLPEATATVRGGIELFSDTDQSVAATAVSTTASRTYGLQLNSAGQGVINVPWVDTNTTYSVGDGLTSAGTVFSLGTPGSLTGATTNALTASSHTHAVSLTAANVGLGNVDNTTDASKSVASAATLTTARTFTIGATGKSFNGGANVSWTTAEMGVLSLTGGTVTARTVFSSDTQTGYASAAIEARSIAGDTMLSLHASGATAAVLRHVRGGNGFRIENSSGGLANLEAATVTAALTGNATTATALQTARTLTIGATGKSFNGGANVSWSLAEIGAAAAASPVLTGTIDFSSGSVRQNVVTVAALDINCSLGNYFIKTINGASTFTVSSVPSTRAYSFTLELTHTSGAITWFAGLQWPGNTAPTLTAGKTHLFMFVTDDGGTRWRGSALADYEN